MTIIPNAVRYAVALGCTTATRLAFEYGISEAQAANALRQCVKLGLITDMQDGTYHCRPMEMSE